jgi:hypothetical protein
MALPTYSSSVITAVSKVEQKLPFPAYIMGGQNASTYKLFKKSTTYVFNVWRSPVYQIGKNFDVMEITIPIYPNMTTNMSIIPVLYFDNEDSNSVGATINPTNYPNGERLIKLTSKNFSNSTHGKNNFFLELQFTGTALAVAELPINIELEVEE